MRTCLLNSHISSKKMEFFSVVVVVVAVFFFFFLQIIFLMLRDLKLFFIEKFKEVISCRGTYKGWWEVGTIDR